MGEENNLLDSMTKDGIITLDDDFVFNQILEKLGIEKDEDEDEDEEEEEEAM